MVIATSVFLSLLTWPHSHISTAKPESSLEKKPDPSLLFIFGICGIAATILVGTGEFLVHYTSTGYIGTEKFLWLKGIEPGRITAGHFLMLTGMPLYLFGYGHLYLTIRPGSELLGRLLFVLGIFAFMTGGVWAGSRALLTEIVKADDQALILYYHNNYEVLVQVLRLLIILISIVWAYAILKTKTLYPKWVAIFNPALVLGLVFLIYFTVPSVGKFLVPTAMNVTHFIVFSLSMATYAKRK